MKLLLQGGEIQEKGSCLPTPNKDKAQTAFTPTDYKRLSLEGSNRLC